MKGINKFEQWIVFSTYGKTLYNMSRHYQEYGDAFCVIDVYDSILYKLILTNH